MIQQGGGWIASSHLAPAEDAVEDSDADEVKAKVVDAPAKRSPKKTAGAKTK